MSVTIDYTGKTVVITGGTGGIGLTLARAFADAGAVVTATGATQTEVDAAGDLPSVRFEVLDVRSDEAVKSFAAGFDKVGALVNGAGVNLRMAEFTPEGFATTIDINLSGTMRACNAFRDKLSGGGAILNFGSVWSFFGAPYAPGYTASKGGVLALTRSLATAFAAEGIRVNAVAPGWIETPMTAPLRADPTRNAELMGRTPMGRWGTPDDLTGPVLFLCSPLAGFVTGVVLPVDGGYLIS